LPAVTRAEAEPGKPAVLEAETGARSARVRARASRHQTISYAWSATQTAATSASAHERRHDNGNRQQQRAGDRGAQTNAAERARHTQPECHIGEQVERGAAAEGKRRDRVELVADMCERRLHREREQDNAGHHGQMQVGGEIAGKGGTLRAAR